jgi:uncharacterized protein (DUF433 family)
MKAATAKYTKLVRHDAHGRARLQGTRYRVSFLAAEHIQYRWSADDLLSCHPDLTTAQIDAALAYFYDHRTEIEMEIAELDREWVQGRAASGQRSLRELKARAVR